jgi:hypothetical protein
MLCCSLQCNWLNTTDTALTSSTRPAEHHPGLQPASTCLQPW